MSKSIDQKAYLQKYLGGPSKDKKKKKKKAVKGKGFKIIDDDIDLTKLRPLEGDELDILDEGEDAPQIAGIVDERPEELRKLEQFTTSSKWKVINQDDGFNSNLQIEEIKKDIKETEKENEIIFGKMYSDSEDEKEKNDSDLSPPRKNSKKHGNDSDFSPPRKKDQSPKRKETKYDSRDQSPKRKQTKYDSRDQSPKRKETKYDSRDQSPKRRETKYDSDVSPPRKQEVRKERKKPSRWGDADPESTSISPKNESKARAQSSDLSPARRNNYDSDASPPRKRKLSPKSAKSRKARSISSDMSPPRKNDRRKSVSPVRKSRKSPERYNKTDRETSKKDKDKRELSERNRNMSDRGRKDQNSSDAKNNRRQDSDSDLSPPRRDRGRDGSSRNMSEKDRKSKDKRKRSPSPKNNKRKYNSDSDLSPPRKVKDKNMSKDKRQGRKSPSPQNSKRKNGSDSDLSPPRKGRDRNISDRERNMSDRDRNMPDRDRNMPDRDRNKQRRGSDSPPPTNKKMAKTLEGKMAGLQDARQLRQENEEFRRKEDEVFKKLGDEVSGRNAQAVSRKSKRDTSEDRLKQKEKAERQKELDAKYQKWTKGLKQIEAQEARVQDFMHEASKPLARHKDDRDLEHSLKGVERAGDPMLQYIRERKRERGELAPERPTYKGNFPPNRFNIRPGCRWDGVDRSNGYEKKFFDQQSKRKAQEEDAYKWSTEDL